jgi:hypothetical protein
MREFVHQRMASRSLMFTEGTSQYNDFRRNLLKDADRQLFLGISNFRRSHDLLTSGSSFWAHVTLYYSSWFAAQSVLAVFGCWTDGRVEIDVLHDKPGSLQFTSRKLPSTRDAGGHREFWSSYYDTMRKHRLWIDPLFTPAVDPVKNDPHWQIDTRNRINYHPGIAFDAVERFESSFDATKFPSTLPGEIATQYQVSRSGILLAAKLASDFSLTTDVFSALAKTRALTIERLVFGAPAGATFSDEAQLTV